jgi:AraC family transcriptional regulator, transcriptional activator of pobA
MLNITYLKNYSINKPGSDETAFKLSACNITYNNGATKPAYFEYYTVFWVKEGDGEAKIDFGRHKLTPGTLMFLLPFQPFVLEEGKTFSGTLIEFSSEFFCIEKHRHEVSCNGVLFNGIYGPPFLQADEKLAKELGFVVDDLYEEFGKGGLSQEEMLFSYLKIFLIKASREKVAQLKEEAATHTQPENTTLINFQELVEGNFSKEHGVSFYADKLFIQPNTLSKLTKRFYGKSPGQIIKERVMVEAKRMLYLTQNSVKEISYGLGFDDPAYFNRFFKKWAQVTPEEYRQRNRHVV